MKLHAALATLLLSLPAMATEQAFPPTAPGVSELKTLPVGTLLKAAGTGNYFAESGRLFRPLFNYISTHDIKMSVPVEAQIDDAAMYFWVTPEELAKVAGNSTGVEVIRLPERPVAARGIRGSYSQANFEKVRAELLTWLADQTGVEPAGPAYMVYWHGPFTPWFAKRSEVQVPVRPKG